MRILLDTHIFIWFMTDDPKLSQKSITLIEDPFDRLLIAQSIVEQLPIMSVDTIFDNYHIQRWR